MDETDLKDPLKISEDQQHNITLGVYKKTRLDRTYKSIISEYSNISIVLKSRHTSFKAHFLWTSYESEAGAESING